MERELLQRRAQALHVRSGHPPHGRCHLGRKGGREPRNRTGGASREPTRDQALRADEDVEPLEQVRLEALPRLVRDLEPSEVRRRLTQPLDHADRHRVPAAGRELVHVERHRGAGSSSGREMREQRLVVEGEVRRGDHRDGVGAEPSGVLGQRNRVARRLRATVNGDREAVGAPGDEQLRGPPPLLAREQNPLPRCAQGEDPVEPAGDQKRHEWRERVLVQRVSAVTKRRHGRGESPLQHEADFKLRPVNALRLERDGPILRVTLARPERRNAFDAGLIRELAEAFADVGDARVIVLAGEGKSFCAGADVDWQRSAIDLSYEENVEDATRLYTMLETIDSCPAPVVARVQGHALGGGSGLVCCTDIAIAAEDAVFGFSEVKLGIIPAVISPVVFERIGTAAARRLFLTGERFDAETALRIGLVHEVSPDPEASLETVVGELLTSGPEATREAKRLIRARPGRDELVQIAARLRTSPEGQEGLRAFLEKRRAGWTDPA